MAYVVKLYAMLKAIYKPKYIALNLLLAAIQYGIFLYLAYVQGGGSVMLVTSGFFIWGLIITSSIALTVAIYSIKNTRRNNARATGTAASFSTLVVGTGLCGCSTTFPAVVAAGLGMSNTGVYALSSFLKNYNPYIFSILILLNLLAIGYYLNRFTKPDCKIKKIT